MSVTKAIDYLSPDVPGELPWHAVPRLPANVHSLKGYGCLVDDYENFKIEIVAWPAQGWRAVDDGTGDQGGTTSGIFEFWWEGDSLFGRNHAVNGQYLLGWSKNPIHASRAVTADHAPQRVLLWHANYHPDGGQLFFPLDGTPYVVPLALPGDDVRPEDFVAFVVPGDVGLYIHPNVWHEGVFPMAPRARFYDAQGRVHARVSCNIAQERGVFLDVSLRAPDRID